MKRTRKRIGTDLVYDSWALLSHEYSWKLQHTGFPGPPRQIRGGAQDTTSVFAACHSYKVGRTIWLVTSIMEHL